MSRACAFASPPAYSVCGHEVLVLVQRRFRQDKIVPEEKSSFHLRSKLSVNYALILIFIESIGAMGL